MTREASGESVSPALLEAQQRLLAMREERGILSSAPGKCATGRGGDADRTHRDEAQANVFSLLHTLPDHLGWGSEGLTRQLRQIRARNKKAAKRKDGEGRRLPQVPANLWSPSPDKDFSAGARSAVAEKPAENATVRLYPTLAMGMLRAKMTAAGRVWLLLRWLDKRGQGWIASDRARQFLCDPRSSHHLCSWRQLRSLLTTGEGVFWEQRDGRIWLRSVPKVAKALDIRRLRGNPVELPLAVLLAGMGAVRAHFYASFHSGRKAENPISRAALANLANISPRSQQNYERRANVRKRRNYAIGPRLDSEKAEELAWENGSACFSWQDHAQIFGEQEGAYIAWQLPNSYEGPHKQRPDGRQRQFNRQLTVLSNKGMTGNEQGAKDVPRKRYFTDAGRAVRLAGNSGDLVYWRDRLPGRWYCVAGSGERGA